MREINPTGIAAPFSNYSHAVLIDARSDILFVSGQLGIDAMGEFGRSFSEQLEMAFDNLDAILLDAGMSFENVVKLTVWSKVEGREAAGAYRKERDRRITSHAPSALYAVVNAFSDPRILVEVEAIAAAS